MATVPTQKSAHTIMLDNASHRIYLPAASSGPLPAAMLANSFVVLVLEPAP